MICNQVSLSTDRIHHLPKMSELVKRTILRGLKNGPPIHPEHGVRRVIIWYHDESTIFCAWQTNTEVKSTKTRKRSHIKIRWRVLVDGRWWSPTICAGCGRVGRDGDPVYQSIQLDGKPGQAMSANRCSSTTSFYFRHFPRLLDFYSNRPEAASQFSV